MRILYATDGSREALAGAEFLARLSLTMEDHVTLFTAVPETGAPDPQAVLCPARAVLGDTAASVSSDVAHGNAAEAILRAEAGQPVDLIVVGSRGLTGLPRLWLGSVAERVARYARASVLVARPITNDLRQAILGYDGSRSAHCAAEWLQRFPLPEQCDLRITTVLPFLDSYRRSDRLPWPPRYREIYEEQLQEAKARLGALVAGFVEAGRRSEADLKSGDPAETLLRLAQAPRADLIVVGARGRSGLERFLLGSVSEKVLRHADCCVLIVKEPSADETARMRR